MAEKLKNPEKADLNKDGKLSSYEKKRGAAIEKAMDKSEGMSRAQQAAIAIAKMKKEELAELVREVLAEKAVEEAKAYDVVDTKGGITVKSFPNDQEARDFAKNNTNVKSVTPMAELTSVGHVDDEPGMLKQFAYDTADYAAKLYKLLHHYEQMEDHVDFPNWWQHKVMMAREYMSKATHYLEFETMKPHLDAKIDAHSEEELDEANFDPRLEKGDQVHTATSDNKLKEGDYEPRTKEDLVYQYLRDAWQFGALKGKHVNPDEELSTMADSLLANLPDYDAAELSELFGRAKNKMVNYQGHDYEILDIDSAGTFTLIDPKHKFYVNKNQMKQGRVPDVKEPEVELINLKEDDEAEPSKKDMKAAEKETGGKKTHFTPEAQKMHNIIKNKVAKIEKKVETGDDYKLDLAALKQYISKPEVKKALGAKLIKGMVSSIIGETVTENKATCCGKCGRSHVKGTECKKPFLTGKDHCRVR